MKLDLYCKTCGAFRPQHQKLADFNRQHSGHVVERRDRA